MSKVTIELSSPGIIELLKSEEISGVCEKEAERMTKAAGFPYVSDVRKGWTRVIAGGYQKKKIDKDTDVCPKCNRAHPNCRCNKGKNK